MPQHDEQRTGETADRIARLLLEENREALQATKDALKRRLMREAMRRALEELGDPERMAEAVYEHLGPDPEIVVRASEAVQTRLVQDIVRRSLEPLQDPEAAAREIVARMDTDDERIRSSELATRDRFLKRVLSDVLQELHEELSAGDDESLIPIPLAGHESHTEQDASSMEARDEDLSAPDPGSRELSSEESSGDHASDPDQAKMADPRHEMEPELVVPDLPRPNSGDAPLDERRTWVNRVSYQDAVVSQLREPEVQRERAYYYTYGVVGESVPDTVLLGIGIQAHNRPFLVPCGPVFAIVSKIDGLPSTNAERDARLREAEVKRAYKSAHIRVLEAVADAGYTVVPRPYGTLASSEGKICSTIEAQAEAFESALERLAGRREWSVQLYRTQAGQASAVRRVPVGLYASGDAFARYDVGLEDASGADGGADSSGLVSVIKRSIYNALLTSAVDATMNATYAAHSDKGMMVLNAAYLVDANREEEFLETAGRLNERQRALGFTLEWSGPRVPLSFWQ